MRYGPPLLVVTIDARGKTPPRRIGADHEGDVLEETRLLQEGRGPRQLHRGLPRELGEAPPYLPRGEGRFVHVEHRELEVDRRPEDLRSRPRQADVSSVPWVEGAGKHRGGGGCRRRELAVRTHGDPGERTGEQTVDRRAGRKRTPRATVARCQHCLEGWRRDSAALRQTPHAGPGHQAFLGRPVAPALVEDDRGELRSRIHRHRDVTAMVALLRSIAHKAGRRPEPDWHRLGPGYRTRAPARALGHGDRGLRPAGLPRGLPT